MKKYTVTITSTETATVEIIANSEDEAIEKAADMDYGELDWCCGESDYEIDDEETIEYTDDDAMKDIMKTIDRYGFDVIKQEDGHSALTFNISDRVVHFPLSSSSTAKEFARSINNAYADFNPGKEALRHIHSIEEEHAARELMRIPAKYHSLKDRLFRLVENVEKCFDGL